MCVCVCVCRLEEEFVQFCEHLAGAGLQERAKREREVTAFQGSRALACSTNHQLSVARVRRFQDQRDKVGGGGTSQSR